jgi:putative RNA 2'-phosphotransferase
LVLKDGLKCRNQVYVHLSEDIETAYALGKRHSANPVILKIDAKNLIEKGQEILYAGKRIDIPKDIPVAYICKYDPKKDNNN